MAVNGRAGFHLTGANPLHRFTRRNVFALIVLMNFGVMVMKQ